MRRYLSAAATVLSWVAYLLAYGTAGLVLGTVLTTPTLASAPERATRPACEAVQPSAVPDRAGLLVGPDPEHLTFLPRADEPPADPVWKTCWRVP